MPASARFPGPVVPMIAIPTTAGTGSEVTASSVITDSETHFKMAVISYYLIPGYALLDPRAHHDRSRQDRGGLRR